MSQRLIVMVLDVAQWARAHIPRMLLPLVVALRTRLEWSRSAVREDARTQMRFLLEKTRPEADLEAVARRYVRRQAWRGELRWHPEMVTRMRVEGMEHMHAAMARGRGVMLNFIHHGTYEGALSSVARLGAPADMIVHPYMVRPDAPRWLQQHLKVACFGGGRAVSAEVGTRGIVDLLGEGRVVAVASDVPGRTQLRFVGRDVLGSFGAARIAAEAGSPVIVMTSEEDDNGPFVRLHEALDPAVFPSPHELLQQMLTRHEQVVLRWPEATDLPLSRWGVPEVTA
jgi:lauroyl/myristoyl acyltransferase